VNALSKVFRSILNNRVPGQVVIQITDRCNARCPQCGMRATESFTRSTLATDAIKRIIDAAASRGVQAISFTGGEPLLDLPRLVELIRYAGDAGIPYIRTGTNGFMFRHPEKPDFSNRVSRLVDQLANTSLRNFWISLDSAVDRVHEAMRGFPRGGGRHRRGPADFSPGRHLPGGQPGHQPQCGWRRDPSAASQRFRL
jgi:MoaA/NifB/PqqE/SkfB family radical SAM enzyme